ncbi:hypothetical protein R0381_002059 [Jeongeupia wiesaeckerbachi]|uniref:hypothetical protein n=1 Tax=Jeongeupia wiesaeckerbachi TaxID=3051218 RepID=UPI003D800669
MSFEEQILQAITSVMPENAKIRLVPGIGSLNVGVSWKLNDDPERPNKMSKTIAICVTDEAAQDIADASAAQQAEASQRVSAFLSQKLANFDPNHNTPKYEAPPIEQWLIGNAVLVG